MRRAMVCLLSLAAMLCCIVLQFPFAQAIEKTPSSQATQEQEDGSRQIVLEEFTKARPASRATSTTATKPGVRRKQTTSMTRPPRYTRKTPSLLAALKPGLEVAEIGVTVWRLRPATGADSGARMLVMQDAQTTQLTPERIEVDSPLRVGDKVRLSVESPRSGYLYVIDREVFADGSLGDAYMIFPTTRTRGGDNSVGPGKLIDIPAQEDRPSFFTLLPTTNRSDQVGEMLSIIVSPVPLQGFQMDNKPVKIAVSEMARWEHSFTSAIERFEMDGGAGQVWSNAEKAASALTSARLLTQEEPPPQTIYRVASQGGRAVLVTVPLRYGR